MTILSRDDYITILKHYGKKVPKGKTRSKTRRLKQMVERLIAQKLCHCLKAVKKTGKKYKNERIAAPICIQSVLKNRGLKLTGRFTCRKKYTLISRKNRKLVKTRKIRYLHPRRRRRKKR